MQPKVELKTDLQEATKQMVFAARLCYGQEQRPPNIDADLELMRKILRSGHWSILEHASAAFYITGVSRNFTHQFVRHRHMSFAQQSFHYTVATDKDTPYHPKVEGAAVDLMDNAYKVAFQYYAELMKMGVPKEEARHVLPSGISTRIVATASLREWLQFVQIRTCSVNCFEIQQVALQVSTHLAQALPYIATYLGPSCFTATCKEGARSCGKPWTCLR